MNNEITVNDLKLINELYRMETRLHEIKYIIKECVISPNTQGMLNEAAREVLTSTQNIIKYLDKQIQTRLQDG